MMGIHPETFEKAKNAVGAQKASCAIFIMLQLGKRIRDFGAYFHSITLGCVFRRTWAVISRDLGHAFHAIVGSHFTVVGRLVDKVH